MIIKISGGWTLSNMLMQNVKKGIGYKISVNFIYKRRNFPLLRIHPMQIISILLYVSVSTCKEIYDYNM